jgi:Xaa-Pro aminopeptidase
MKIHCFSLLVADALACAAAPLPASFAPPIMGAAPAAAPHVADALASEPAPSVEPDTRARPLGTEPFPLEVFRERRARLMGRMKTGVAVVLAATHIDVEADARQDADFFYLTGLGDEAGAALLLAPQEQRRKEWLFLTSPDPERDRWTGYRQALPSRALELRAGIAQIKRMAELGGVLSGLAHRWHDLHFFGPIVGYQSEPPKVMDIYGKTSGRVPGAHMKDSVGMLTRMRMVKEPREIERIARASEITAAGHVEAMRRVRPGMREWELKEIVEQTFRRGGARRLAYGSIVGGGPDGCVLHYPNDDRAIGADELVLIDAGAEFEHYATDVTRTFPASGKFTPEQRHVYEVVLAAQKAALAKVRPGVLWEELRDTASKVIADAGYYDYYIHSLGHFVGLEVHDAGMYDEPIPEGAVITIEPGIYMPGKRIGVRIEDTVLVTKDGPKILSAGVPREPDAIEALMAEARRK